MAGLDLGTASSASRFVQNLHTPDLHLHRHQHQHQHHQTDSEEDGNQGGPFSTDDASPHQHLVGRRPRGRPPGSKNKPKPPVIITRESANTLRAHILEVASARIDGGGGHTSRKVRDIVAVGIVPAAAGSAGSDEFDDIRGRRTRAGGGRECGGGVDGSRTGYSDCGFLHERGLREASVGGGGGGAGSSASASAFFSGSGWAIPGPIFGSTLLQFAS
ncbi:AT-hook motif nuclear-localized protein 23-like [Senna tora]|uniref:AT-hook motif nuclear-localized protein 23-like n=1 Tax=Senna tora TaxID=362788 RepID=A0A834TUV3_9FABA|nr:AT-hook motif nuclear-localized protein 23-like [Senna tora]